MSVSAALLFNRMGGKLIVCIHAYTMALTQYVKLGLLLAQANKEQTHMMCRFCDKPKHVQLKLFF